MKNKYLVFFILAFLFHSCYSDISLPYQGKITGPDYRKCVCCGGWFVEIDKTTFRFYELPKNTSLVIENEKYPINVDLDYQKKVPTCLGDEIILIEIQKR